MKNLICLVGFLSFAVTMYAQNCPMNEDARRYWVRANAALKDAKSEDDYLNVCEEFKKALEYAPDCPDIYYNIGICYDKSASTGLVKDIFGCKQAAEYLKKYLEIKPDAQNKREVQDKIYELEFKYDKLYKSFPFIGKYSIDDDGFSMPREIEIIMEKNIIMAIVPQNNMETKYDTLIVENYRTKEGAENLKFCQNHYMIQNRAKDKKLYRCEISDICYYLTFNNRFVFQSFINGEMRIFINNKFDKNAWHMFNIGTVENGVQNDDGEVHKFLTADKITKIE